MDNLSYFAGILDGEGCVGFHSRGKGKKRFVIEVKMTCEPIIDWLQATYGGSKNFQKRSKPHHKDQWRWRVQGEKAQKLYSEVKPFLKLK